MNRTYYNPTDHEIVLKHWENPELDGLILVPTREEDKVEIVLARFGVVVSIPSKSTIGLSR